MSSLMVFASDVEGEPYCRFRSIGTIRSTFTTRTAAAWVAARETIHSSPAKVYAESVTGRSTTNDTTTANAG